MSSIAPFIGGFVTGYLVRNLSVSIQLILANSYLKDNKYMYIKTFRNYKNLTLVNKEAFESKGYAIDLKNYPGWFFKNIAELTITKNDAVSDTASKEDEYKLLRKAMQESDFHATHIEDDDVKVYYFNKEDEKSE
jgi:hypothetical protein